MTVPRRRRGPIERAAAKDLKGFERLYAESGVGKAYLDAAQRMDADPSDRDAVALSREMRLCYEMLNDLSPKQGDEDSVDEFTRKREERMRGMG